MYFMMNIWQFGEKVSNIKKINSILIYNKKYKKAKKKSTQKKVCNVFI